MNKLKYTGCYIELKSKILSLDVKTFFRKLEKRILPSLNLSPETIKKE